MVITTQARIVLEQFLASDSAKQWLNESSHGHTKISEPGFTWECFLLHELEERNHKRTAERVEYEAEKFLNHDGAKYAFYAGSMADWIDEEMTELEHKNIWPQGYRTVCTETMKVHSNRYFRRN